MGIYRVRIQYQRVNIFQPDCGVGGRCIAVDPYFITGDFPMEACIISQARKANNYKSFWCTYKVKATILEFELKNNCKSLVAMLGLAFNPNIDDVLESSSKSITTKVFLSRNNADIML